MLRLDDAARPAMLQACHPSGESKFHLQMKSGGLIRVHTSALQQTSQYKSLLISEQTTSDELLSLLLSCYNSVEPVEQFSLYEVCPDQEYQRKLHADDLPLKAQIQRNQKGERCHFLVRRIIRNFSRRSLKLDECNGNEAATTKVNYSMLTLLTSSSLPTAATAAIEMPKAPLESSPEKTEAATATTKLDLCLCKLTLRSDNEDINGNVVLPQKCHCNLSHKPPTCKHCNHQKPNLLRGFRSDSMSSRRKQKPLSAITDASLPPTSSYNPVYSIRTVGGNSFSSLGSDKSLMELDALSSIGSSINRRHSVAVNEIVNSNPSLGIGNYVYI